ncbi:Response regulators consisting of a CheY-like receiver domain and a winged-helix DNA-binding domain [butyrate-producing bacterium SM4/1]|nr:Response regulators consisting of a CheY-like receiver domain and a winged-helix DNA-binding domain [butyrate-producing bacterium SM4/1]
MSRILIVEDEEAIAELEKDYLELSGFEVEIEDNGETGLKRALEEDFDLLILDLMLPGVDGFEDLPESQGGEKYAHYHGFRKEG